MSSHGCTGSRNRTTRLRETASSISIFRSRGWSRPGSSFPAPIRTAAPTAPMALSASASDRRRSASDGPPDTSTSRSRRRGESCSPAAAAVGEREGHRPRAAAAMGHRAVPGHVGGTGGREPTVAGCLSQHDREHDGGSRSAERHLRARRHHVWRGIAPKGSPSCRIRHFGRAPTRCYDIDETLELDRRAADDRQAVQSRQRVSGGGRRVGAPDVRQGDDRVVYQRQLRRSADARRW